MWGRASGANANWQQQAQQANPRGGAGGTQDWWSSQGSYQSPGAANQQWEDMWDFTREDR